MRSSITVNGRSYVADVTKEEVIDGDMVTLRYAARFGTFLAYGDTPEEACDELTVLVRESSGE